MKTIQGRTKDDRKAPDRSERCILFEAIIEIGDHEFYFATGYCRYCHQAVETAGK